MLDELVGHSLIGVDRSYWDSPRFTMLETVRAFASEHLEAAGEVEIARAAQASVCLELGRSISLTRTPEDRERWVGTIGSEYDNIRTALSWFLTEGSAQHAIEMASFLWRFWEARALATEGVNWLRHALDRPGDVSPEILGIVLNNLANLLSDRSDFDQARTLYTQSLEIARTSGSRRDVADVLNNIGLMAMWMGDNATAEERFRETIAIRRETKDEHGLSGGLLNAGDNAMQAGDLAKGLEHLQSARRIRERFGDRRGLAYVDYLTGRGRMYRGAIDALPLLERSLAVFRSISDTGAVATVLVALSRYHARLWDFGTAAGAMREALVVFTAISDRRGLASVLECAAEIATVRGRPLQAARLLGAAASERHRIHVPVSRLLRPWHLDLVARTKAAAGEALFTAAWWDGHEAGIDGTIPDAELELQELSQVELDQFVMDQPAAARPQDLSTPGRQQVGLTQQEIEVLQQVARGLGDREIGYELGIGQRTVSTHVANLLTKLAVPSRSAAAAAAVRMGFA